MGVIKDASMQIAAGGSAGLSEICLMHPLDLVKTRLQVQNKGSSGAYKSMLDVVVRTVRTEGFLSLYKGILPPILAETPKRATKFFTFEQYRKIFTSDNMPLPFTFAFAGFLSGCTEAIVVNPFEVVKVGLQSDSGKSIRQQKSAFSAACEIYRTNGIGMNGLNRGLTATLARHGIWNMIYFGLYHTGKLWVAPPEEPLPNFLYRALLGFTAGTLASIANIPTDVAKSRIQGPQPVPGQIKYRGLLQSMLLVYREEGFAALYKGLAPKIMRLGPGGAVMLIVYESVYDFLKITFP